MKKKLSTLLVLFVLCFTMAIPTFASGTDGFANEYARMQDLAELLSEEEALQLNTQLDELSIRQKMDVIIVTTDSLEGYSVRDYADSFYDECHFGYGENKDGLLLLISMEDSDWYISTCGYAITAFTDAGIQYIGEQIVPDLSNADYISAFETYINLCDEFITQADIDTPYDTQNLPAKPLSIIWIFISILIGVIIAGIIVAIMYSQLKSVRSQPTANSYVKKNSMVITNRSDLFLYRTVTKHAKPKENVSSGSSTHTSSSGTTHGGGGGKF